MDRPQLIRRLRIAASMFSAVVTVALVVLWVRSYWRADYFEAQRNGVYFNLSSAAGGVFLDLEDGDESVRLLGIRSKTIDELKGKLGDSYTRTFRWISEQHLTLIIVPHWFLGTIAAALSSAFAIHWSRRFSLRTLLIATTLVAVVLGLGVWAAG